MSKQPNWEANEYRLKAEGLMLEVAKLESQIETLIKRITELESERANHVCQQRPNYLSWK